MNVKIDSGGRMRTMLISRLFVGGWLLVAISGLAADLNCVERVLDHPSPGATATYRAEFGEAPVQTACLRVLMIGTIERGDSTKLADAIKKSQGLLEWLYLVSPGGDLREAMEIGRLIRKAYLQTMAPDRRLTGFITLPESKQAPCNWVDCICASACFIAWSSGVKRAGSILGIHRPRFDPRYFSGLDLPQAEREYHLLLDSMKTYLAEVDLPPNYYDRMMDTRSSEVVFLTEQEAEKLRSSDFVPSIDEWLTAKCGSYSWEENLLTLNYSQIARGFSGVVGVRKISKEENVQLEKKIAQIDKCRAIAIIRARRLAASELLE